MLDMLTTGLGLIVLIVVAALIYIRVAKPESWKNVWSKNKVPNQAVIKRDWVPTGRIDFATELATRPGANDKPSEFKLLVEERRIVESIAGNENLEIQWRLATLREAKSVVTQYHKYLSEHSLIKTVSDGIPSLPPPHKQEAAQVSGGQGNGGEKEAAAGQTPTLSAAGRRTRAEKEHPLSGEAPANTAPQPTKTS